jgi:hypothetical protein
MEWQEQGRERVDAATPGSHLEQPVDELNLSTNIRTANPPRLPLPNPVHRFITLNRSPRCLELSKPLLGVHKTFDRSVVLFQNVVPILHRSMSAAAAQGSFFITGMAEPLIGA